MQKRISALSRATGLKKTTIIEMCVKHHLPALEERYAKELAELARSSRYPERQPENFSLNETPNSPEAAQLNKEVRKDVWRGGRKPRK